MDVFWSLGPGGVLGGCPAGPDLVCFGPNWCLWNAVFLAVVGPWGSGCIHLPIPDIMLLLRHCSTGAATEYPMLS